MAGIAASDPERAIALARKAKATGQKDATIHWLTALGRKAAGDFEGAIAEAGEGLRLAPSDARLLILVGYSLVELRREREAAKVLEAAIRAAPNSAEAHYGYGWAAEHLGALPAARSAFERTVALDPGHADALAGLAGLAVRTGDWATARPLAERAYAASPWQTDALTHLARIDLGEGDFAAAERRFRDIIVLERLNPQARAEAKLLLGDALDGQRRYREAFDAYAEGNRDLRTLFADVHDRPGAAAMHETIAAMVEEFQSIPDEAWRVRDRAASASRSGLSPS